MKHIQPFSIFLNESLDPLDDLIEQIKAVLTPDLLKGMWKAPDGAAHPTAGHCYAATESLYWMLGGPNGEYTPYVLSQLTSPDLLGAGETHWFLRNKAGRILDVTVEQFEGCPINYTQGKANGMMTNPVGGSKRARTIMARVAAMRD